MGMSRDPNSHAFNHSLSTWPLRHSGLLLVHFSSDVGDVVYYFEYTHFECDIRTIIYWGMYPQPVSKCLQVAGRHAEHRSLAKENMSMCTGAVCVAVVWSVCCGLCVCWSWCCSAHNSTIIVCLFVIKFDFVRTAEAISAASFHAYLPQGLVFVVECLPV